MDVIVCGTLCAEGAERETAYRLLATALQREFGIESMPDILRAEGGKPYFGKLDIHFNISHSHGAAVIALHDKPVGIDVEKLRPAPRRLSAGMDDESFFREWTAKEATVKQRGQGIGALLRRGEIDPLCLSKDDFLPGWIVTLCPVEASRTQWKTMEAAELI